MESIYPAPLRRLVFRSHRLSVISLNSKKRMKRSLKVFGFSFVSLLFFAALAIFAFGTSSALAVGEKFFVEDAYTSGSSSISIPFAVDTGSTLSSVNLVDISPGDVSDEATLRSEILDAVVDWAVNNGYSGATAADVIMVRPNVVTSVGITSSDFSISGGPITSSGNITANLNTSGVSAGTYEKVTVNSKGIVTAGVNPSDSYPARSLDSCFQISSTRAAFVNYSVDIAATLSLISGQTGTVFLETYSDSGCTTGTQEITRFVNGNTGTLSLGLNITQNVTGTLTGYVPAGKYVKIRTANTSGTPTFNYRSGQEVLW